MQTTNSINSTVFFRHRPEEVEELSQAVIPLATHIAAVAYKHDRSYLRHILNGKYFRARDAMAARALLLRACKHARAHLSDYFPILQAEVITSVTVLEQATERYWERFCRLKSEIKPKV